MRRLFHYTVSAIAYDIARGLTTTPLEKTGAFNDVAEFVLASWGRMPRFLAWPIAVATIGFSLLAVVTNGGLYHRLSTGRREVVLASWRASRIGACRDLIRFFDSLTILAFYSRKAPQPSERSQPSLTQLQQILEHAEVL